MPNGVKYEDRIKSKGRRGMPEWRPFGTAKNELPRNPITGSSREMDFAFWAFSEVRMQDPA
jgi:hypothetical protein